ncbi:MBL fold metallo-hydrolase [Fulvivirga lutimaris]|uniref:MBL fold metallo-hydrolase n=1 Tax=Fulvivirga lutimaris TaxID=1819566 RepID=UPI0012BB8B06|nr:MBL fold metallo-hydrolase [Fulvivirga lutimaris]MTI40873.1 MBL fold metallo-hydrolase [Fulvivirga lutimaris]
MRNTRYIAVIILTMVFAKSVAQEPKEIINQTIEAMGGLDKWKSIEYINMKMAGHKYWLEQSENPNGPYITSYEVVDETRGVWKDQLSRKEASRMFQSKDEMKMEMMINGDKGMLKFGERVMAMPSGYRQVHDEWMRYAPEKLVLDALKYPVKKEQDKVLEGTEHWVVSYVKNDLKHTLYINRNTHLLYQADIETFTPYDLFNYPWGKFMTTIKYSLQWLYPAKVRYPAQWDVYKLGKPFRSVTIYDIDFNPDVAPDLFTVPEEAAAVPEPTLVKDMPLVTENKQTVGEDVYTIPGSWYVAHAVQEDGILVIESPITSGYSERHIAFLEKKYPNKPIKAVFVTSDAWPHIGGARAYAARNIPIYTHRLNEPLIKQLLAADYSMMPDAYEKSRPKPKFNLINEPIEIKDKTNPVKVVPVNGEGGERMIMLYFPKTKVLYASDLVQYTGRNKEFFSPQYLTEVKSAVDKYKLDVETVFAFHTSPIPYKEVLDFLKGFEK